MKYKLENIQPAALEIWEALKPHCKKIKIAGSIRRQCPLVKDIEIVLLPKTPSHRNTIGLFFLEHGRVRKGKFSGKFIQVYYKGFPVDVFIPQEHDYFRQLAIRTGSADYSRRIAANWVAKGYRGTDRGLVKRPTGRNQAEIFKSERHFFALIDMPYLDPPDRH